MAAGDKKKKKPAQTEERAKGLLGLEKGKKVEGAAYSVGNYKGKTLNLTNKQLGAAGRKAASARVVDISQTKYEGKKVLGPGGKPLTGTVDLGGGNMAVYKNGVRVRAQKPKPKAPTTRTTTRTTSTSSMSAKNAEKLQKVKNKERAQETAKKTPSPRQMAAEYRRRNQVRRGTNAMYNRGTRVSMSSSSGTTNAGSTGKNITRSVTPRTYKQPKQYGTGVYRSR